LCYCKMVYRTDVVYQ